MAIEKNPRNKNDMMIGSDSGQLFGAILLMVGALLPVVNPLGDAPIILRKTPGCDEMTRAFLAKRIAFHSFLLLLVRLSAFIMVCLGVGITWNGVKALLEGGGQERFGRLPFRGF